MAMLSGTMTGATTWYGRDNYGLAGRPKPPPPPLPPARPTGPHWPEYLLEGYSPASPWQALPATDRQLEALGRRGLRPPPGLTRGEAAHALYKANPKMLRPLRERGLAREGMTYPEAKELIDALSRREGWGR